MSKKPKIETCLYVGKPWTYDTRVCEWHMLHVVPPYIATQGYGIVDSTDCARCKCWEARDDR